jgi:hypothetical protein
VGLPGGLGTDKASSGQQTQTLVGLQHDDSERIKLAAIILNGLTRIRKSLAANAMALDTRSVPYREGIWSDVEAVIIANIQRLYVIQYRGRKVTEESTHLPKVWASLVKEELERWFGFIGRRSGRLHPE